MHSIAAIVFLIACAASAQSRATAATEAGPLIWEPPTINIAKQLPPAASPKPIITMLRIGRIDISLEDTELSAAEKSLGAKVGRRGDASQYVAWLCFHGKDSNGRFALWLESSEIAGGVIDGFAVRRIPSTATPDRRWRVLQPDETVMTAPIQVHLGMTKAQVLKVMGQPTAIDGNILIFEHEHNETIRGEPFTADNTVYAQLDNGIAARIQVWKDTTD